MYVYVNMQRMLESKFGLVHTTLQIEEEEFQEFLSDVSSEDDL